MPNPETLLLFLSASVVFYSVPGPSTALVIARSITDGRRIILPMIAGLAIGDSIAATVALTGAGALLAASDTAFATLRALGAAYLIWLGLALFRAPPVLCQLVDRLPHGSARATFRDSVIVATTNPLNIFFFIAFVPQFIHPTQPYASQSATLVALYIGLGMLCYTGYAFGSDGLRRAVRHQMGLLWLNRFGGTLVAGAGVALLLVHGPIG